MNIPVTFKVDTWNNIPKEIERRATENGGKCISQSVVVADMGYIVTVIIEVEKKEDPRRKVVRQ